MSDSERGHCLPCGGGRGVGWEGVDGLAISLEDKKSLLALFMGFFVFPEFRDFPVVARVTSADRDPFQSQFFVVKHRQIDIGFQARQSSVPTRELGWRKDRG